MRFDWKQFLIGVLGTAIGVGLTFFVSGLQEKRNQAHAQRLTAIMVIHDIDNTVNMLKQLKENEEKGNEIVQAVLKKQDHLDAVPYDTLAQVLNTLMRNDNEFRFDTSKERIFNSDLDTWQNLGCMKFIDNVQSFYYERQVLQEELNQPDFFREPISRAEYMDLIREVGWATQEEYARVFRPFVKEKLRDKHVLYYINVSSERIRALNQFVDTWNNMNEENKFLMGLTDKELEDYVNSISDYGKAVSASRLLGRWECSLEDDNNYQYDFHRDRSYDFVMHYSALSHGSFWSGRLKYSVSYSGNWSTEADSLVVTLDASTLDLQLDLSGLVPEENRQDTLDSWAEQYRKEALKYYDEVLTQRSRNAFKARLDSTHDKMEWTNEDGVRYLKRKE